MDKPKRGPAEGARAARGFGAEFQANPGSSRSDYLNDAAYYFGVERFCELDPESKKVCLREFNAGIKAEKELQ